MSRIALSLCLASCGRAAEPTRPQPEPAPWPARASAYETELGSHREGGWLVVRTADGYRDEGDSLTWSGEAMGISCGQAEASLVAVERLQEKSGGYYLRFDPLPDRYSADVVSRDGWIGVVYGMTRAWHKCPALQSRMADSWHRARSAVGNALTLHPQASAAFITPQMHYLLDAMDAFVDGAAPAPRPAAKAMYELATETTVRLIVAGKTPCYPLHLAFSEAIALAAMGSPISEAAKRDLCEATASTGLINWRWFCQDDPAAVRSWLEQYQPNRIVYAHQRCSWETEDFPSTDTVASLDWLTLRDLYVNGG